MQEQIIKQEEQEIDLREIFYLMKRKVWLILLCTVVGAVLMFAYTKNHTVPMYESTSKLYIFSDTQLSSAGISLTSELTLDFIHLANSRPVMEDVIADLELTDWTSSQLARCVTVSNPEDSHLLIIDVKTTNPELSKDVANSMAKVVARRVAEIMNADEPSIMEEAIVPSGAVDSGIKRKTLLGGLVGAILVIGMIFLLYILDDTIKDEDDVEKYLGLRTLASFPKRSRKKRGVA